VPPTPDTDAVLAGAVRLYRSLQDVPGDGDRSAFGEVTGRLRGASATWEAHLALDAMSHVGHGSVDWAATPTLVISELDTRALDLQAFMASLPETSVTGRVRGNVSGPSVDSLDMDARLTPGAVAGRLSGRSPAGRVGFDYRVALEDSVASGTAEALTLTVERTDSLAGTDAEPALHAAGRATGRWRLGGGPRRGSVTLSVDSAVAAGTPLRGGEIRARLEGDSLTADIDVEVVQLLDSPVRLQGTLESFGLDPQTAEGVLDVVATRSTDGVDSLYATVPPT
jgi:hypothetical protein